MTEIQPSSTLPTSHGLMPWYLAEALFGGAFINSGTIAVSSGAIEGEAGTIISSGPVELNPIEDVVIVQGVLELLLIFE